MDIRLSDAEKVFIIHGAEEGMRSDGRGLLDYRPIVVETGVLATTNGSARVRLASTDLLIGVKAELMIVNDFDNYRNRINFFVDCSANATPLFVGRGGEDVAVAVASALDTAYDNPYVLPHLNKLILSPMHAWKLYVDIVVLECGGNILDAAGIGVKAALQTTEICDVIVRPADEGKSTIDLASDNTVWKLDASRAPLFVTVHKLGEANLVDASLTEEACSRCTISVAVSPSPASSEDVAMLNEEDSVVTMVRQSGGGSLEMDSIDEMTRMGVRMVNELQKALDRRLKEELEDIDADPSLTFLL
ncbi:Exosome complex component RRP42 [Toxocara canis]|uniref:Ribosomal RNA-processing protein 42 n=1 Tax=Toxocara canis TaxID=6265 RepID=A0A0B2UUV0_TOXCA|nr:Exosome complex component RRP42 [Toxocara canis]